MLVCSHAPEKLPNDSLIRTLLSHHEGAFAASPSTCRIKNELLSTQADPETKSFSFLLGFNPNT
jgi:hypothetical protein